MLTIPQDIWWELRATLIFSYSRGKKNNPTLKFNTHHNGPGVSLLTEIFHKPQAIWIIQ